MARRVRMGAKKGKRGYTGHISSPGMLSQDKSDRWSEGKRPPERHGKSGKSEAAYKSARHKSRPV